MRAVLATPADSAPAAPGIRPITAREFRQFQALIYREAGIWLAECKEALLVGRLSRRLRELGISSFGAYYRLVAGEAGVQAGEAERVRMLDAICTHETHFFREPRHFEFLDQQVFPQWAAEARAGQRQRRVRVWSAACSSGEEPYSLAILLLEHFPASDGWQVEVVATDLSTRVLERARTALWPVEKARSIPERYLKKYMLKGTRSQEGMMTAGPRLRSVVSFQRVNLNDDSYPVAGTFDLIFCRNVLIYFNAQSRRGVVDRLLDRMDPRGYFFLGHAETLNQVSSRVRTAIPTVYSLAPAAPPARAA